MRVRFYHGTGFSPRANRLLVPPAIPTYLATKQSYEIDTEAATWKNNKFEFRTAQTQLIVYFKYNDLAPLTPLELDYLAVLQSMSYPNANGYDGPPATFYYFIVDAERVPAKGQTTTGNNYMNNPPAGSEWRFTIQLDYWATFGQNLTQLNLKNAAVIETTNANLLTGKYKNIIDVIPPASYGYATATRVEDFGQNQTSQTLFRLFVLCDSPIGQIMLCENHTANIDAILNSVEEERARLLDTSIEKIEAGAWIGNPDINPIGAWYLPVNNNFLGQSNPPPVGERVTCISSLVENNQKAKTNLNFALNNTGVKLSTYNLDTTNKYLEVGTVGHRLKVENIGNQPVAVQTRLTITENDKPKFVLSIQGQEIDITEDFAITTMQNAASQRANERNLTAAISAFGAALQIGVSAGTGNVVGAALGIGGLVQTGAQYISSMNGVATVNGVNSYFDTFKRVNSNGSGIAVWSYTPANAAALLNSQKTRGYSPLEKYINTFTITLNKSAQPEYYRIESADIAAMPVNARNYVLDKFIQGVTIIYNAAEF